MRRVPVRSSAVLLLLAALAAPAGAEEGREVNLYSARHYDTDLQLYDDFTRETGIAVNVIEGGADELIERITAEGENSPADVLITTDAGRLWRADQAGLFQPVASAALEQRIPAAFRDPQAHWFALSKRARIIIYNKAAGRPEGLDDYEDLADPRFRGKICIRSSNNDYNQSLLASIIAADGAEAAEKWAAGVVANMARPPQGPDTAQIEAVAAGECDIAVVNTYYVGRYLASADPDERAIGEAVGIIFPNQGNRGTHVNISGAGVLAHAPDREAAVRFLEFLAGDEAQRVFAEGNNEYPIVPGVPVSGPIAAFGSFKEDPVAAATLGENNALAVQIFDRVGWP